MSFTDILFTIAIKPLELLFEFIFAIANSITPNPGYNLIVMSLAINFLVLPLYRRADAIQMEAKDKEAKLRPMMEHIKKYFKGDERVMILQTFYKIENYNPLSSLKSLISLVLQIPFFIAAYQFLSHLPLLNGQSLGPITDLSKPDGLITIGALTINLLPVLMTVINIVSSEIYTRGQPFKDKIVLYLSAAIFLVLLYNSPSGLVFYWTFNNVFSLFKNIFYRIKNPGFVFKIICAVAGVFGAVVLIINRSSVSPRQFVFLLIFAALLELPLIFHFLPKKNKADEDRKLTLVDKLIYLFGLLYVTVLMGVQIPSAVISSSPEEFIHLTDWNNPTQYIWYTLCVSIGFFLVWTNVFYLLATPAAKRIFAVVLMLYASISTLDYMLFGLKLGTISAELELDAPLSFTTGTFLINTAAVLALAAVLLLVYKFKPGIIQFLLLLLCAVTLGMSIVNISSINKSYAGATEKGNVSATPQITLSRNGKNVVVIMLDRAIGSLVPYLFNENKNLEKEYDGFTFYPNTISYGAFTNFGVPPLFGGYEYTPVEMNKRSDELLKDKHNEALRMLPALFSKNGYDVTFIDPPYSNYSELPDLSIFDGMDNVHAYTAKGIMNPYGKTISKQLDDTRKRNFFIYSIFKTSPLVFQESIYNGGNYHSLGVSYTVEGEFTVPQVRSSFSNSKGVKANFMDSYYVLESMPGITSIEESGNYVLLMNNNSTHEPMLLQEPEYVPSNVVDNKQYDMLHISRTYLNGRNMLLSSYLQMSHYQVNMAAYKSLGRWFNFLREQGVWDNTRIIIVADHGRPLEMFNDLVYSDIDLDVLSVNPVLMVKDYNCTGFTTSDDFMTNADVPTIAVGGLIDNPVNPYTNKAISNAAKSDGPAQILISPDWRITVNNGTQFLPGNWYSVYGNIFERSNWNSLGRH